MRSRLRHFPALTTGFRRDFRQFFFSSDQDITVTLLQVLILMLTQTLFLALRDRFTGFLQQAFYVFRPSIPIGVNDKCQFSQ
jgi:hypothetical protein